MSVGDPTTAEVDVEVEGATVVEVVVGAELAVVGVVSAVQATRTGRVVAPSELGRLIEPDLVENDPPRLTDHGREVREAIEAETNRTAQQTFDLLDDEIAGEFLAALQRLPGQVD